MEEIALLSDADKKVYLDKLEGDFKVIQEKIEEVTEKTRIAREEAQESIRRGEETLANFRKY